jgi:hypothetical protein
MEVTKDNFDEKLINQITKDIKDVITLSKTLKNNI